MEKMYEAKHVALKMVIKCGLRCVFYFRCFFCARLLVTLSWFGNFGFIQLTRAS